MNTTEEDTYTWEDVEELASDHATTVISEAINDGLIYDALALERYIKDLKDTSNTCASFDDGVSNFLDDQGIKVDSLEDLCENYNKMEEEIEKLKEEIEMLKKN
tara:strand:+ start:5738 stop:6049 length:312 start_codon:yes stop_codon:yes gene_type:complete